MYSVHTFHFVLPCFLLFTFSGAYVCFLHLAASAVCVCVLVPYGPLLTLRKYCLAYLPQSCIQCASVHLCREKVAFWAWPMDILGKEVNCEESKHLRLVDVSIHMCVFVCLSPAGPGCLKVIPSPCEASWRAASADGGCCCCTVCLAHASPSAGH